MRCLECEQDLVRLDNEHLLACSGLTLHEYAIRHHQPLDLLLQPDQVGSIFEAPGPSIPSSTPCEDARATLQGLSWCGLVDEREGVVRIPGEVRRLNLLLWDLERLADFGFRFRQEYLYRMDTHRVVARSYLQAPAVNLVPKQVPRAAPEPPPSFLDTMAVYLAHIAEYQAGYLLMPFTQARAAKEAALRLRRDHRVNCTELDFCEQPGGLLLRTDSLHDTKHLLALLRDRLQAMPDGWERFQGVTREATVTKELIFDAAHFISDHPAKCSNLHGGRYLLQVQVTGSIDPVTGCVLDYGYLKRVVNRLVVERFDHHTLNYAAPELAWRSSTEMICVFVWEQLIGYLPGLSGLRLYETSQSWCDYRGPTLADIRDSGGSALLHHFRDLGNDPRRQALTAEPVTRLRVVGT